GLPRRRTKDFRAKTSNVEPRRAHGHHLDRATRQPESHRPNRILTHPVGRRIQSRQHHALRRVIPIGQILDLLLAILNRDVRAKIQFAAHKTILNQSGFQFGPASFVLAFVLTFLSFLTLLSFRRREAEESALARRASAREYRWGFSK